MAKISLCMIVKENDEAFKKCIGSVSQYVDEIVIVTEDKSLLKERMPEIGLQVYSYKWRDDFAAARNFSFSKAKNDIVMWLDADDVIKNPEKLPELAKIIEDGKADWVWLEYEYERDSLGRVIMRQWQPRLMRKDTMTWKLPIHEALEPTTAVTHLMDNDVVVVHQTDEDHRMIHGKRNLKILVDAYQKDKENSDPRLLYYLGNTLLATEKFAEAIPFYQMHIAKCGWPEEKYFSLHYLSKCHAQLSQWEEAIQTALQATTLFPNWSLAYFDIGEYYSKRASQAGVTLDWKKAIEWILVGLTKKKPDSRAYFTSDTDYTVYPMGRLADSYLQTGDYHQAHRIAKKLIEDNPNDKDVEELLEACETVLETEDFVESFVTVAQKIGNTDRIKAAKVFDCLPGRMDEDHRIQGARMQLVPPKSWENKSIAIYCGKSLEDWAKPSIYTGIGGSETAVINLSEQLAKLGWKVTVYNQCGDFRGEYSGVTYTPYYHFDQRDNFDVLVGWRAPALFELPIKAKKKILWLHDIAYPHLFSKSALESVDRVVFLSKWHRDNLPDLPDEKVFISNNGIDPKLFDSLDTAKEPNSLIWSSSYDRGLLPFIKNIFPKILEKCPDTVLNVAYGWNNILKETQKQPGIYPDLEALYTELSPILESHPNIVHHGRLGQGELAKLMGKCMVMPYASEFGETNNITSQMAQAAGCYVITTSQAGGTPERVKFGTVIEGDGIYTDSKLQEKFANEVVDYLNNKAGKIMDDKYTGGALANQFSWATTANQWRKDLL